MPKKACAFILFFIFVCSAHAATYYVSTAGNDANPGTQSLPFGTIQKGLNTVIAGDALYVRGGQYTPPRGGLRFKYSGTKDNPITVSNYPGEQVILKVDHADESYRPFLCTNFSSNNPLWNTPRSNYIKIIASDVTPSRLSNGITSKKGIVIQGVEGAQWIGISGAGCDNWEVAGIDFIEAGGGLFLRAYNKGSSEIKPITEDDSSDGWYIHDNRVYNYYREVGIQVNGDSNTVENNEISKVSEGLYTQYGCHHMNILGQNNIIRGNRINRLGGNAICGGILFEWDLSDNNLVEKNLIIDVVRGIEFAAGDNNVIRNNIIYSPSIISSSTAGITVYSYNNRTAWPCNDYIGSGTETFIPSNDPNNPDYEYYYPHDCHSRGNQIYNNVVHNYAMGVEFFGVLGEGTVAKNNALSGWTRSAVCFLNPSNGQCQSLDTSLAIVDHNADSNFGFVDSSSFNFHLNSNSILINSGYNLGQAVPDDFDNVERPQGQAHDIGAYEYVFSTPAPASLYYSCDKTDYSKSNAGYFKVDELTIVNNQWNTRVYGPNPPPPSQLNYQQCIKVNTINPLSVSFTWNWPLANVNPEPVKAYPGIIYGFAPYWPTSSTSTTSKLPVKLSNISSYSVTYDVSVSSSSDASWNTAFDIFITTDNPPTTKGRINEIMIMLDYQNPWFNNPNPDIGTFIIDGRQYRVSSYDYGTGGKGYMFYIPVPGVNKATINITTFLNWLMTNHYIDPNNYLADIEFGNEIISGTGTTTINNYDIRGDCENGVNVACTYNPRAIEDTNNDGVIDINDIKEVVKDFGKSGNFVNPNNDVNSDTKVNFMDIVIVAKNFGK